MNSTEEARRGYKWKGKVIRANGQRFETWEG
jgi:hypothetical protein